MHRKVEKPERMLDVAHIRTMTFTVYSMTTETRETSMSNLSSSEIGRSTEFEVATIAFKPYSWTASAGPSSPHGTTCRKVSTLAIVHEGCILADDEISNYRDHLAFWLPMFDNVLDAFDLWTKYTRFGPLKHQELRELVKDQRSYQRRSSNDRTGTISELTNAHIQPRMKEDHSILSAVSLEKQQRHTGALGIRPSFWDGLLERRSFDH